jgi:hypothetical protein
MLCFLRTPMPVMQPNHLYLTSSFTQSSATLVTCRILISGDSTTLLILDANHCPSPACSFSTSPFLSALLAAATAAPSVVWGRRVKLIAWPHYAATSPQPFPSLSNPLSLRDSRIAPRARGPGIAFPGSGISDLSHRW